MGSAIEITRLDRSAAELHGLVVKTADGDVVRRLLGIVSAAVKKRADALACRSYAQTRR